MKRLKRFSILRFLTLVVVYLAFLSAGFGYYGYSQFAAELPEKLDKVLDYRPERASRVYSADGELIGEFFLQKRVVVPLDRIPNHVILAFVSAEDRRFWNHHGFDPIGIGRAAIATYWRHEAQQGGSTITQQVTRMLMLSNEKTFARKAKELILSVRVDRELSKEQILKIYLNHVYLGHGAYGVQAAAEEYFGKDVEMLTLAEAAMLAGMPKAPGKMSPYNDYHRARERQAYVLNRMREDGYITAAEERDAKAEPLALVAREEPLNDVAAPYFVEYIRRWAVEKYGDRLVMDAGLEIHTTLVMKAQRAAEAAVKRGLENLDRRLGFRGPIGHLDGADAQAFAEGPPRPYVASEKQVGLFAGGALLPEVAYLGIVTEIKPNRRGEMIVTLSLGSIQRALKLTPEDSGRVLRWRSKRDPAHPRDPIQKLEIGDLVPVTVLRDEKKGPQAQLAQVPDVQGALLAMNPKNGDVVAMVGGYQYAQSQFNRATQAKRQAGSSIKPFIYTTALENGYTEMSIVQDAPIAVKTATGIWAPANYKNEFLGSITLRRALEQSINTVSVRLVLATGVDAVVKNMRKMGITSAIPRHISIALGTPDVTLLEMVGGYATFPTGGKKVTPRFVTYVQGDDGRILEDDREVHPFPQVIDPSIAYVMVDLMKNVVAKGTGRKALALGRPAGGKTGTSTGFRDAWFIAYTTDLVCGVWVGRDNFKPIGHNITGGEWAAPIWLQFMQAAHPDTPVRGFTPPADITFVRANVANGEPVGWASPAASWIPFVRGTIPPRFTSGVDAGRFSTSGGFR